MNFDIRRSKGKIYYTKAIVKETVRIFAITPKPSRK
jgi:hypothetical protein